MRSFSYDYVPPFTFNFLSLSCSFALKYVTVFSMAAGFMVTMASSETPYPVTTSLLIRLECLHRSYVDSWAAGLPRVSATTQSLPTHLHYSHPLRKGLRAFVVLATRPRTPALRRFIFIWAADLTYPFFRFRIGSSFCHDSLFG